MTKRERNKKIAAARVELKKFEGVVDKNTIGIIEYEISEFRGIRSIHDGADVAYIAVMMHIGFIIEVKKHPPYLLEINYGDAS